MNHRNFFGRILALGSLLCTVALAQQPNFVIIYCDDHVTESIQHGALVPNIDSLREEGLFFPEAYSAAPACTPARYNALTGQYAGRCRGKFLQTGITEEGQSWVHWNAETSSDDWIGAKMLRDAGYATGLVGKIGAFVTQAAKPSKAYADMKADDPNKKPLFEENQRIMVELIQPFGFDYGGALTHSNMSGDDQRHAPEFQLEHCIEFIEASKDQPFYLHFAPHLMHMPQPMKSLKGDPRNAYGVMLDQAPATQPSRESVLARVQAAGLDEELAPATWLDDTIGVLLQTLEKHNLADNTLVIFMQDNGHHGGKGSVYEGGANVLGCWMRWPDGIKNPSSTNPTYAMNIDFVPTMLDAAGVPQPEGYRPDGISLLPALQGSEEPLRDSVFVEIGHTRAVLKGDWKYIAFRVPESHQLSSEQIEQYKELAEIDPTMDKQARVTHIHRQLGGCNTERAEAMWTKPGFFDADQLYNLSNDSNEQANLASNPEYAAKLNEMKQLMRQHMMQAPGTFAEFKGFEDMSPEERAYTQKIGAGNKWTDPPVNTKNLEKAKRQARKKKK